MSVESEVKVTKRSAVAAAINAGKADDIDAGIQWIKEEYDLDITKAMFSSYKSSIKNPKSVKERNKNVAKATEANGNGHASDAANHTRLAFHIHELMKVHGRDTISEIVAETGKQVSW